MSAAKKIVNAWTALTGFLEKHVKDLQNVGSALQAVNSALPIDAQDKARIADTITAVEESAANIASWLDSAPSSPTDVTVKESDLVEAIGNYFNTDAGKATLAAAIESHASAEGNGA